jgi:hypothetical protein
MQNKSFLLNNRVSKEIVKADHLFAGLLLFLSAFDDREVSFHLFRALAQSRSYCRCRAPNNFLIKHKNRHIRNKDFSMIQFNQFLKTYFRFRLFGLILVERTFFQKLFRKFFGLFVITQV